MLPSAESVLTVLESFGRQKQWLNVAGGAKGYVLIARGSALIELGHGYRSAHTRRALVGGGRLATTLVWGDWVRRLAVSRARGANR